MRVIVVIMSHSVICKPPWPGIRRFDGQVIGQYDHAPFAFTAMGVNGCGFTASVQVLKRASTGRCAYASCSIANALS